ncbi:MAG TPA: AAA family ATPase, partial [Puia sp.]|nr:AAA family ATPase [Puia sp.]
CLLGNPSVLVFDEPTNGLDPSGIAEIRQLIIDLAAAGKTIILASHLLAEVEKVCTHVAILQKGVLIKSGDVLSALSQEVWLELGSADMTGLKEILERLPGLKKIVRQANHFQVYFTNAIPDPDWINRYCFEQNIVLNFLQVMKKSLESAFIELTDNVSN